MIPVQKSLGKITLLIFSIVLSSFLPQNLHAQKKEKIEYDEKFEPKNGMIRVRVGQKYGYLNAKGKPAIEVKYASAEDFDENGFAKVSAGSFYELINKEGVTVVGGVTVELTYYPDFKRYLVKQNVFGHSIYDEKGVRVASETYALITDINANGIGTIKKTEEEKYGIVSLKTGMLTKMEYKKIYGEAHGMRTYEKTYGSIMECGYFDAEGKKMPDTYDDAFDYSADGLAVVKRGGLYGYIDKTGNLIHDFQFSEAGKFKEGTATVLKNGIPGLVDTKGGYKENLNPNWTNIGADSEGYRWVSYFGIYGFIDKEGVLKIPVLYQGCYGFTDGVAGVKKNNKYGYVDAGHKEIIPIKYDFADKVSEGMIRVKDGSKFAFFNVKGEQKTTFEFDKAENFSGGFAKISVGEKNGKVDKAGKITWEKETEYFVMDDPERFNEEEKLKNVIDAKTVSRLSQGPVAGLQIHKANVESNSFAYFINDVYYQSSNDSYFAPAVYMKDDEGEDSHRGILYNQGLGYAELDSKINKTEGTYGSIIKSSDGMMIGAGSGKIQEFTVTESGVTYGNFVTTDLYIQEICETTNGIIAGIAKAAENDFELYVIFWDRKNKKVSSFLVHNGAYDHHPNIAATNNGQIVIAFDAKPEKEKFRYTVEKIDVTSSLANSKLKSVWKRTYSTADKYRLTDMIVDTEQNIVGAFRSVYGLYSNFTDDDKTQFEYVELGIVKCNSNGEEFRNNITKSISPDKWGRSSDGGSLKMRCQSEIYISANENPLILENPYGKGYIVCSRYSYGLWEWSAEYQDMNTDYKTMYADQPAFFYIDENSLDVVSTDFIESTYNYSKGHSHGLYSLKNQLGKAWDINCFKYFKESDRFVITEDSYDLPSSGNIWEFKIKMEGDWDGEYTAVSTDVTSNTTSTNNSSGKTNSGTTSSGSSASKEKEFSGSVYFKYDMMGNNSAAERLYIHYGSNAAYKVSTTKGSSATMKCQEGKVYYSFTGEKKDMQEFMTLSPEDCGKTFKYTDFK